MLSEYIEDVKKRYDLWWEQKTADPLVYAIFPEAGGDISPAVRDWMAPATVRGWTRWKHEFVFGQAVQLAHETGDMYYVDDACGLLERYADVTGRAADGFHFLFVNLGASMMSAFLTGVTHFDGETIWLEMPEELSLDEILALGDDVESDYAKVAFECIRRLIARLEGRFVFAPPELGGPMDILAAMRKTSNLLLDTMDSPEKLDACFRRIMTLWDRYDRRLAEIIDPANPGCWSQAMRLLSPKPSAIGTCDFSAMIGPDAFERWVMPDLRKQTARCPSRVFFHLDGPGEIVHLDAILSVPGLGAVQWVPGAGNPGGLDDRWHPLYRRILDAGKNILLSGTPSDADALKRFFQHFPAGRFYFSVNPADARETEAFQRLAS